MPSRSWKVLSAVAFSLQLTNCASSVAVEPPPAKADPIIGTTRWTNPKFDVVEICAEPKSYAKSIAEQKCRYLKPGTAVTFDRTERHQTGPYAHQDFYWVTVDGGDPGYMSTTDAILMNTEADRKRVAAAAADCKRRGGVASGMTREQVYASCWGRPERINKTITGGRIHEQLVYGRNYVYLDNGVVSTIQTTTNSR